MVGQPSADDIESWIRRTFPDVVYQTRIAAEAVMLDRETVAIENRSSIVDPLRTALADAGLFVRYVELLEALDTRLGRDGPGIVPGPPYVLVTSRGPVLRLSTRGWRVVITFELFAVERGEVVHYRYRTANTDPIVSVEIR